jgi:hypothetical protein
MYMHKLLLSLVVSAAAAFAQYNVTPAGAPPSEASAMAGDLQKDGLKVAGPNGVTVEIWFRSAMPGGGKTEENATMPDVPHGTLLGVMRTSGQYADRRGQSIKPGVYTMRYSVYPVDGNHQGVAPQRDFIILSRIAEDKDPKSAPAFDPLMDLSRKASGTPHPLCLSMWKGGSGDNKIGKEGDTDWVLNAKIGDTPVDVILFGVAAG